MAPKVQSLKAGDVVEVATWRFGEEYALSTPEPMALATTGSSTLQHPCRVSSPLRKSPRRPNFPWPRPTPLPLLLCVACELQSSQMCVYMNML